jgi:hypothetical protein
MSDEFRVRHGEPVFTQRATATTMDETASSRPWNAWVTTMIQREILAHEKALLKDIWRAVDELIETKVRAVEIEIGQLRADVTIQSVHRNGEVIDLPNWRRRRA